MGTREQSSAPPSPHPLLRRLQRAVRSPRSLLLSKPDRHRALSRSSEDTTARLCPSFGALLRMHSRILKAFLNGGAQNHTQYPRWGHTRAKSNGVITSFDQLVVLCFMPPRMQFPLLAVREGCWLFEPPVNQHPQTPFAGLLSSHCSRSLPLYLALFHPSCRILHLDLFNFMQLVTAQCSNLPIYLCKASCPSRESAAPPSLVSSGNLPAMHSTPACRSLIQIWNRTGPRETPLLTANQPDVAPFTTTRGALPFSQFFTQRTAYLLVSQLDNLSRSMLSGTVPKALLKSRKTILTAFLSSTGLVMLL